MVRDSETILKEALKCFQPSLSGDARPKVLVSLQELAKNYRELLANGAQGFPPARKVHETPDAYWNRWEETQQSAGRKGRPRGFAANALVHLCREMLIQNDCDHSVSRNRKAPNHLGSLSALVHELSGLPERGGWQERAEKASEPGWEFRLTSGGPGGPQLGKAFNLDK